MDPNICELFLIVINQILPLTPVTSNTTKPQFHNWCVLAGWLAILSPTNGQTGNVTQENQPLKVLKLLESRILNLANAPVPGV